jgi:GAF domain-containing protein
MDTVRTGSQDQSDTYQLAEIFGSLQSLLLTLEDLQSFLLRLTGLAVDILEPRDVSCGITLRRDGEPYTVASSDTRASRLDDAQYTIGDGPCLQSMRSGETVWLHDLDIEDRWSSYIRQAHRQGLEWSLSLALRVDDESGGTPLGALNVYGFAGTPEPSAAQQNRCELFAAQAAGAVQLASNTVRDAENRRQLEAALRSRSVIDQALGILIAERRCTAEEAFALLRTRSQHENVKLRQVAAELIQRVTGHPPQPGAPFG